MTKNLLVGAIGLSLITALCINGCSSSDSSGGGTEADAGLFSGDGAPGSCTAGAKTCITASTAAVCPSDGSGWVSVPCRDDEKCTDGECKPDPNAKCAAGTGSCVDAQTALRCKADLAGFEQVNCPAGSTCTGDGVCQGACVVGSSICTSTGVVATCTDGKTYTPTACGDGQLCVAVSDKPWPTAACKPAACKPATNGCDYQCGNKNDPAADQTKFRSRCVATPSGYQWVAEGCLGPATCDPTGASCGGGSQAACKTECTPGAMRCSSDKTGTQTCGQDGKWGTTVTSCGSSSVCMTKPDDSTKVVCGDPLCATGAAGTCDVSGGFKACGTDGKIAAAATPCTSGICVSGGTVASGVRSGSCQSQCTTGEEQCVSTSNSNAYETCVNGRWGNPQTCSNQDDGGLTACYGYTNSVGKRAKLCGAVCSPGTKRCMNTDGGVGNGGIQTCNQHGQWDAAVACDVGLCQTGGGYGARCVADCIPNSTICMGSSKSVAGTGYTGTNAYGTCTAQGFFPSSSTSCTGASVCRKSAQGQAIVSGGSACVECVGPNVPGGNENGLVDQRCSNANGDATGTAGTQVCTASNTWGGAVTSCANGTCAINSQAGATCQVGGGYALANLTGTKRVAFVFAPAGTSFSSNADYANFCTSHGFTQNQNSSNGSVYTSAGMYNATNYYCTQYCCYLGSGNNMASNLSNFQNFGLPTNTQLQVFDRGCGDYCPGGSFNTGVTTVDSLTVSGPTSFSYAANTYGGSNYCAGKTTTFARDGVVICEEN